MLTGSGGVKVLDFGIARHMETGTLSNTRIMGTLAYMPPERFDKGRQDARGTCTRSGVFCMSFSRAAARSGICRRAR